MKLLHKSNQERRCLMHIGAPKTGSTALERFLAENESVLQQHGWEYPRAARRAAGHHDLAFLVSGGYPDWAMPQPVGLDELIQALQAEVAATSANIILSSENFYLQADPQDVASMLERIGFSKSQLSLLVYVRRQDQAHLSWYNQKVKAQGYTGTIAESVQEFDRLWDYAAQLEGWASVFGAGQLHVQPYEAAKLPDADVRRSFLSLLELPAEDFKFATLVANTRLKRDALEFQRQINHLPLSALDKRKYHDQLIRVSQLEGVLGDAALLDARQRTAILDRYRESNQEVAMNYLGQAELFDESLGEAGNAGDYSGLTTESLARILAYLNIDKA